MSDLQTSLDVVLRRAVPGYERLVEVQRLSGGASQETHRIDLEANGEPLALAMRRGAGGVEAEPDPRRPGLAVEARILEIARAADVPEPEVVYVLEPTDGLGPGFLMEWLDGETLGSRIVRAPELDEIRPHLARECGRILARIHGIDTAATGLDDVLTVLPTREFVELMWQQYQGFETPQPMIDYTARWLLDHLPDTDRQCLVHNDFRNGNLIVTPDGIAAVLDWEVAHLGDPVRDLGWMCTSSWRFGRSDLPVGGFGSVEDLLDGYEEESGVRIGIDHLRFWEVFGSFWWAVGCLGMADAWRNGPDPSVERPGVARRSSECQADCANLIIPGPVELVTDHVPMSSVDMPRVDELLVSVRDFLRDDLRSELEGRSAFLALVASNSVDIVRRELELTPAHLAGELARLRELFDSDADLLELRWALTGALRSGRMRLDEPGLADHLRTTVINQLAIDQPRYPALEQALSG